MTDLCPREKLALLSSSATAKPQQYTSSQIVDLRKDLDALTPAVAWIDEFVTRTNPHLGRAGVVCPYMPEAIRRDMLQYFVLNLETQPAAATEDDYATVIATELLGLRDHFLHHRETNPKLRLFYTYVVVFRGLTPTRESSLLIERVQRYLKPEFVATGLMIGEFHPLSNAIGLRNDAFRPLRSPVPLLSMRNMVEVDFAFLSRSYDPAPLRVHFLRSYLRHVGAELGPQSRRKAEAALAQAELEANQEVCAPITSSTSSVASSGFPV